MQVSTYIRKTLYMVLFIYLLVQRRVKSKINSSHFKIIIKVVLMELRNTIFAILAVFCVVLSACAVSAADDGTGDFNVTDGQDTHDSMVLPPDYAHGENATANATNATSDAVGNAAGENVTSGNTTNATASHTMPATGNPILVLLAVGAVLGGAAVITRRK